MVDGFGGWGHMTGEMTVYGWIVMVLFWFLIVWVIWSLASDRRLPGRDAREVLDERYARGEIDRDHYLESKADMAR
jgi:putative membrane protein